MKDGKSVKSELNTEVGFGKARYLGEGSGEFSDVSYSLHTVVGSWEPLIVCFIFSCAGQLLAVIESHLLPQCRISN